MEEEEVRTIQRPGLVDYDPDEDFNPKENKTIVFFPVTIGGDTKDGSTKKKHLALGIIFFALFVSLVTILIILPIFLIKRIIKSHRQNVELPPYPLVNIL